MDISVTVCLALNKYSIMGSKCYSMLILFKNSNNQLVKEFR